MSDNMTIDKNTALILEGGGLRGVFTCGVLDCFMDNNIHFPAIIGVSAGACNGLSYMSGQRGRAKSSNIDLMDRHHYVGFKYLLTRNSLPFTMKDMRSLRDLLKRYNCYIIDSRKSSSQS